MAMLCCLACRSQPCILVVTARSLGSRVSWDQIGFRREADRSLRRLSSAAWIIDRPPALPFLTPWRIRGHMSLHSQGRRERFAQGRGAEASLIQVVRTDMAKNPATEVQVFAGVDVSARELSVAVRSATMDREEVQTFSNNASGHHALLGHRLRGKGRARVGLEASGNYSLDLALA